MGLLASFFATIVSVNMMLSHEPISLEDGCIILKLHIDFSFPDADLLDSIQPYNQSMTAILNREAYEQVGKCVDVSRLYKVPPAYNVVKIKACAQKINDSEKRG